MIIIECSWCDGELALEAIDAQSVGLVDDHLPVCFRYRG